jgi:hypothetical protein
MDFKVGDRVTCSDDPSIATIVVFGEDRHAIPIAFLKFDNGGSGVSELGWLKRATAEPSPRARSATRVNDAEMQRIAQQQSQQLSQQHQWQQAGRDFGPQMQQQQVAQNFGIQQQLAENRGVEIDLLVSERDLARKALAVSEKDRERLKAENEDLLAMKKLRGEPAAPQFKTIDGEIVGRVLAERNALRRELENLKRSTDCSIRDLRSTNAMMLTRNDELRVERDWMKRELDRERSKKKVGL